MKNADHGVRGAHADDSDTQRNDCENLKEPQALAADWSLRAKTCTIPPAFPDSGMERVFLDEYRFAGLRSVAYACLFGIAAYVAIGVADVVYGAWSINATVRRLIAVSILGCMVALIFARPRSILRRYNLLLGAWSVVAIVGIVSVIHLLRDDDVTALVNPVSLIALWILYGFVRLPIRIAIFVGTVGSLFSMFGSRLTNMHEPGTRTAIYLIMANALGVLLARSIELRERQLFLQRRVAESAQDELEHRTKLAEHASAEKTRLIAAVGHDLRQPMLSAVLHAEVLTQRLNARDLVGVQRQADRVEQSVKLMGSTLEHLLTAARYDAGTEPVLVRPVLLTDVFHGLSDLFGPQAAAKEIELRIREPVPGLTVRTDEQALMRMLMNLVSNAIKFTPPRERTHAGVLIRASLIDDTCRIVVVDNGVGIADSNLDAIWQPFFQVDNAERNRSKGLGLGLYLVRQSLIRLDRHSVVVRSIQGRGTRFVLTIPGFLSRVDDAPIELQSTGHATECSDAPERDGLRGLYIVLIEDDQEARDAIEAQLDEWGVMYTSGISVEQVMKVHTQNVKRVDRIVADFRLPGRLNGIESIQIMRNFLGYEPRAVLITAEVDRERLTAMLPTRTGYVQKPFDAATLRTSLGLSS